MTFCDKTAAISPLDRRLEIKQQKIWITGTRVCFQEEDESGKKKCVSEEYITLIFVRAFASATAQLYKPHVVRVLPVSWKRQVQVLCCRGTKWGRTGKTVFWLGAHKAGGV